MNAISRYLTEDHEVCDGLFADSENAVCAADWCQAQTHFNRFVQSTLRHFAREEEVLFPEFETRTGMHGGPTQVMRDEHAQMRNALEGMAAALTRQDTDVYLGLSETLLMLMRQHNLKEERILYPMADQVVPMAEHLVEQMARLPD